MALAPERRAGFKPGHRNYMPQSKTAGLAFERFVISCARRRGLSACQPASQGWCSGDMVPDALVEGVAVECKLRRAGSRHYDDVRRKLLTGRPCPEWFLRRYLGTADCIILGSARYEAACMAIWPDGRMTGLNAFFHEVEQRLKAED